MGNDHRLSPNRIVDHFVPYHDLQRIGPRVARDIDHLHRFPVGQTFFGLARRLKYRSVGRQYIVLSRPGAHDLTVVGRPEPEVRAPAKDRKGGGEHLSL